MGRTRASHEAQQQQQQQQQQQDARHKTHTPSTVPRSMSCRCGSTGCLRGSQQPRRKPRSKTACEDALHKRIPPSHFARTGLSTKVMTACRRQDKSDQIVDQRRRLTAGFMRAPSCKSACQAELQLGCAYGQESGGTADRLLIHGWRRKWSEEGKIVKSLCHVFVHFVGTPPV